MTDNVSAPSLDTELAMLREMNLGMRTVLDLVGGFVYAKDVSGRYVYANKEVQSLFGSSLDEIRGRDDSQFFDLQASHELHANDLRVMEDGVVVQREERNIIKETGEERVYWTVQSPVVDETGAIVGMCGISTDITDRK